MLQTICNIIEESLNKEKHIFNITVLKNDEKLNIENLISDEEVMGALSCVSSSIDSSDNGTTVRSIKVALVLPINDLNVYYNNTLTNTISSLNRSMFESDDTLICFNDCMVIDQAKLPYPINGIEYEALSIEMNVTTTAKLIPSDTQVFLIDDVELNGIVDVTFSRITNTEGKLEIGDTLQNNLLNSISFTFNVSLVCRKGDAVHQEIMTHAIKDYTPNIKYNIESIDIDQKCRLISFTSQAIAGSFLKMNLVFAKCKV